MGIQKLAILAIGIGFSSLSGMSQTHHVWPAEPSMQSFGRVIDIMELEPKVMALQTFNLTPAYELQDINLSLYNLESNKQSSTISLGAFAEYRGGMAQLKDKSLVVSYTTDGFEMQNLIYSSQEFTLTKISSLQGQFKGLTGGIAPLKNGAYVMAASFIYPNTQTYCNQLLKRNSGESFGTKIGNENTSVNLVMKPKLLGMMYNNTSSYRDTLSHNLGRQVVANSEDQVLCWLISFDEADPNPNKIIFYSNELKEEWRIEHPKFSQQVLPGSFQAPVDEERL